MPVCGCVIVMCMYVCLLREREREFEQYFVVRINV